MKNSYLTILIVAVCIAGLFAVQKCNREAEKADLHKEVYEIKTDSVRHWRDAAGREHAYRMTAESDRKTLKVYYGQLIDSITKELKIKDKHLQSLIALSMNATGRVILKRDTAYIDSNQVISFTGSDGFLSLSGKLAMDAFANYSYWDSLVAVGYYKKRPFWKGGMFGKRDLYIDARFQNPRAHISGLTSLSFTDMSYERFQLDLYAGSFNRENLWALSAGASAKYYITRRAAIELYYQYSTQPAMQREYGGRVRFHLLKF